MNTERERFLDGVRHDIETTMLAMERSQTVLPVLVEATKIFRNLMRGRVCELESYCSVFNSPCLTVMFDHVRELHPFLRFFRTRGFKIDYVSTPTSPGDSFAWTFVRPEDETLKFWVRAYLNTASGKCRMVPTGEVKDITPPSHTQKVYRLECD